VSEAVYLGVFLEPKSSDDLAEWFARAVMPLHETVYCHHMTVMFKPTPTMVGVFPLRVNCALRVVGWAADSMGQAVVVKPTCALDFATSDMKTPHVTVACAAGVKPFYSNQLLTDKPPLSVIGAPVLSGWTGWFDGKNPRYDKWQPIQKIEIG
jgi:hypothetical protein